jgi:hypothetical protein
MIPGAWRANRDDGDAGLPISRRVNYVVAMGVTAMTQFDHSVNVGDGKRYVKMVFPVEGEPEVSSESMWTDVLADGCYQVKNIPAWVSGLSLEDVVVGRRRGAEIWYQAVRRRGGHSTYRIAFQDPEGLRNPQPDFDRLKTLGCGYERVSPRLVALDVPAETDLDVVYQLLEAGMARGSWWFDELHCGHPI